MASTVPFIVDGRGTGVAQDLTVAGDNAHEFSSDTYTAFGGDDANPSPLAYALGALTSCNQITATLVAKDLGVTLGEFTFNARGELDPAVFTQGTEGNANFDSVTVEASVETDADEATFEKLVSELERRCPVTQLFQRSGTEYVSHWKPLPLA